MTLYTTSSLSASGASSSSAEPSPAYQVLLSTLPGPALEGFTIKQELGIVMATATGLHTSSSFSTGKRAEHLAEAAEQTRAKAVESLQAQAVARGANAVFGVQFTHGTSGDSGAYQIVSVYGTACIVGPKEEVPPPPIYSRLTIRKT
ncbi:hypothetical protein HK097_007113 [Rhizophlyctis rosea]|uniref:Heavy metal-binding domain-containing protein n=1 Tax=Rhizophlyctis rosea TaxID=64517 RepID=A0AAD5X4M8_9FUNG|nr:hypothetical protein HK097_007113 [Rhizophlyctis rosea]